MPVVGKAAHMAKAAQAPAHRPEDVEDQAPLLASPRPEAPASQPRRLILAGRLAACAAVLAACAAAAVALHGGLGGAGADAAPGAHLISFADAEAAAAPGENSTAAEPSGGNATAADAAKDFELSGGLLENVTHALVMDDTDAKGDDSMLSVKKGDVVYVHNVSKKGWTFAFTEDKASGFVPSMVLNENSTLVRWDYKPTEKEAKGALSVKSGERVWLTGIKDNGKDWIFIVKPDKDSGVVTGFIPEWAVHGPNSTANSTSSNGTADAAEDGDADDDDGDDESGGKVEDKKKASKHEKK